MNAHWRETGENCPLDGNRLSWSKCGDCPYFRGMSSFGSSQKMLCNWPVNGSTVADGPDLSFDREFWAAQMEC